MAQEQLKSLTKNRGILSGSLTRMQTFIDQFNERNTSINEVKARYKKVNEIWDKFQVVQLQIEQTDLESTTEIEGYRQEFEDKYYTVCATMQDLIERTTVAPGLTINESAESVNSNSHSCNNSGIRLPAIKLATFDGEYDKWTTFADSFKVMVHENGQVPTIQKFQYLVSSLSGQAAQLIQNLPLTTDNYSVAWKVLEDRYQNKRLIASTHIRQLLDIQPIRKESAVELLQFINTAKSNLNAVRALNIDIPLHDLLLVYLFTQRIDAMTRREWELTISDKSFPTLDCFIEFLEFRRQALENIRPFDNEYINLGKHDINYKVTRLPRRTSALVSTSQRQCQYCGNNTHNLYKCNDFLHTSLYNKKQYVKQRGLCFNCLQNGHSVNECPSTHKCKNCGASHHTLLHNERRLSVDVHKNEVRPSQNSGHHDSQYQSGPGECKQSDNACLSPTQGSYCSLKQRSQTQVLLSTAIIKVKDNLGRTHPCRVLLDCGSQSNFITESLAQRLKLRRRRNLLPIAGINDIAFTASQSVDVQLMSRVSEYSANVTCYVLPNITGAMPATRLYIDEWCIPDDIKLADDQFHTPGHIDMLLGSELFLHLLKGGRRTRDQNHPVLQETELGWILAGRMPTSSGNKKPTASTSFFLRNEPNLSEQLQRFWEQEEFVSFPCTDEERYCEQHFIENTSRDETGRFVVRLPRRTDHASLGESIIGAKNRFRHLERKFCKDEVLRESYVRFMEEYQDLGHMKLLPAPHSNSRSECDTTMEPTFYLPHHAVHKEGSTTTKTRVVFDASAKSSNGVSLNDILMVGPTLQQDLQSIVLRFRTHTYAMTADITKMYRQIRIDPRDYNLQRILWRSNTDAPLEHYQLTTVTYGTSSASFLATRCLIQLANEASVNYPETSEVIRRDMYMDDLQTGHDNLHRAKQLQQDLIQTLERGGFQLHKWCANHASLLEVIPDQKRETQLPFKFNHTEGVKTLGLLWHPALDELQFDICVKVHKGPVTKRIVLSIISSIFDPLGLLGPVIFRCKRFMQCLWSCPLQWDEVLPIKLKEEWSLLYDQMPILNNLKILRLVKCHGTITNIQIHGFADASEAGFGACVYLRCVNKKGDISVHVLCSRSRVAPLQQISLPRLELCGALLLARLVKKTTSSLTLIVNSIHLWTDSTVVLAWLAATPTRWKTFVANRVSEIQHLTSDCDWKHVPTQCNPADILSRGTAPEDLCKHNKWWYGPDWLAKGGDQWPQCKYITPDEETTERKNQAVYIAVTHNPEEIVMRFSSLTRLQRVISYCFRFIANARKQKIIHQGPITVKELRATLYHFISLLQLSSYPQEVKDLKDLKEIGGKSALRNLHPFLDEDNILRVGGRLQHAEVEYDQKHPIILTASSNLTRLIIQNEHLRLLHAGPQLLLAALRQRYWIVNGKSVVRHIVHKCIKCFRLKARAAQQLMGQLPESRVRSARPFLNCGVDYAGPFLIRQGGRRSKIKVKCYAAIFICFATKAIHIELVSDLTTEAFIAALHRFSARRGRSNNIYSDNGTNFVGANNSLRAVYRLFQDDKFKEQVAGFASVEGIQWHFIPSGSPHFGGLWEAGVKSMKFHLRRVVGNTSLTFEELCTILAQIEACLNSRPLCQLSADPSDPQSLTPGHFLIGGPITAIPESNYEHISMNRLSRWQLVQQCTQRLWKLWSRDYLSQLQQRSKWTTVFPDLQPGMVVLLKDDDVPPLQWRLAVVEEIHRGRDNRVRVATVRTSSSVVKRVIQKLCPLPIDSID